jgi:uncharacterized protein YjbI with pentapeptide repeats
VSKELVGATTTQGWEAASATTPPPACGTRQPVQEAKVVSHVCSRNRVEPIAERMPQVLSGVTMLGAVMSLSTPCRPHASSLGLAFAGAVVGAAMFGVCGARDWPGARAVAAIAAAVILWMMTSAGLTAKTPGAKQSPHRHSTHSSKPAKGVNLSHKNLVGMDLRRLNLVAANLEGADLTGAVLRDKDLRGANLHNAKLNGARLDRAVLIGAKFGIKDTPGSADLTHAWLVRANLERADLWSVLLFEAHLEGANLTGAELGTANLAGAYLIGANLTKAKLGGANLRAADLTGAILTGVEWRDRYYRRATYDKRTRWSAGFDPQQKAPDAVEAP